MAVSEKSAVASSTTDFSSDSTLSDDWLELTKSDYAKVIFSDLLCNAAAGTVECKFQITDSVHEDPSDYVGLYRIGYDDLSQCVVSKMLCQTKCEDDGKLQRCVFTSDELPHVDDGFYQFLYVTRDQEVCGASMPFLIKMLPPQSKESFENSSSSENMDGGFLLVSSDAQAKAEQKLNKPEKAPIQQNPLSEQKEEEIAAWVSQNPDYSALIEQITQHTYTIDALQQSKDLAMKEVAQLYEILNAKNAELNQMRDMVAAYEEKVKMSLSLQDEKNSELMDTKKSLASYKDKCLDLQNAQRRQESLMAHGMRITFEDRIEDYKRNLKQKEEELSVVKNQFLLLEEKLKKSLDFQYEQEHEVTVLKKEMEAMKKMQKEKENRQIAAEREGHSLDSALKKAENLVLVTSDAIKGLNFTNEEEVDKFFQLKIQLLIILDKMRRASDSANVVNPTESAETEAVQMNSIPDSRPVVHTFSVEASSPPESTETGQASGEASTAIVESISLDRGVEPGALQSQIVQLPRLSVINEDIGKILQAYEYLEVEDITVINRLTEKIIKRGYTLFEGSEFQMPDDCASDAGSDASELSDCSLSMKKDLLSVGKVMEALSSYLSNKTDLDPLIVVEKEADRYLLHRNKWDELLQKCALRYQIELFLEQIEKQKEGTKKVSEKICDLLAQCMVLKDELRGSKSVCENLRSVISQKDRKISTLKRELEFKNTLISHLKTQKEDLEDRREVAERTVEDFRARIVEAFKIYKNQYTEIDRLSRKLEKYRSVKNKTKHPKESCAPISAGSSSSASSFEVVKKDSLQNINDSDTGEHMFDKASSVSKEKDHESKSADVSSVQSFVEVLDRRARPRLHLLGLDPPRDPRLKRKETFDWSPPPPPPASAFAPRPHIRALCRPSLAHEAKNKETEMQTQMSSKSPERCVTLPTSAFAPAPRLDPPGPLSDVHRVKEQTEMSPISPEKCVSANAFAQALPSELKSGNKPRAADEAASIPSDFASYEDFQEAIKSSFASIQNPETSRSASISCFICKGAVSLRPEDLMSHLETEHSTKMCPVCGQLFEDAIPHKYFHIHVEQHFETQ